jgi:phosphoglycerate dehydrogenase-like enzyme
MILMPTQRKLKILYLPHPPHMHRPWMTDVRAALSEHEFRVYDANAPLAPQIQDVDVVVDQGGGHSTHEMADLARSVKLWQIQGTGFEDFDVPYWKSKGIPVANTPGPFSDVALAECAMMYMLMVARRWHDTQTDLKRGVFYSTLGEELENRKLLLFGFGASAQALAKRARGFDMKISAVDIRDVPEAEQRQYGLEFVGKPQDLDRLLPECDYLSLHLHLNKDTTRIIDARRLALMKPTARLINIARGPLVDQEALYQALVAGKLGGAGLDVFASEPIDPDNPLLKLPNVVATPHVSGATDGTSRRRAGAILQNVNRVIEGLEPLYRVDLP